VLCLSVCYRYLSWIVTLCIVAKQCNLEQNLILAAYRKSCMRNQLILKWMTFVQRSYQGHANHCHIRHWISQKLEAWFQRTINSKWPTGYQMSHVTDDVTWPWKVKLVTTICLEHNISKTAGDKDSVPKDYQYTNRKWHMGYQINQTYDPNTITAQ